MYTFFVILHVFVCLFLILVVLLQRGKGSDMGAAFGGASSTLFGARGRATFLQKLTGIMAIMFMILSVVLASLSSRVGSDLDDEEVVPPPGQEAGMTPPPATTPERPVTPEAAAPAPAPTPEQPSAPAPTPEPAKAP